MLIVLDTQRVLIITVVLFLLILLKGKKYWQDIQAMCWRMKWLWLSLLILYGWFIPGSPVFFSDIIPLGLIPSSEGLIIGALRGLVLLNIICAVVLLIKTTSKEALISSIMWFITPFKWLKIDTGVFAARLVLTMDSVTGTETDIRESLQEQTQPVSYLQRGINAIATLLIKVEQQAQDSPTTTIVLPQADMPKLTQWLIPIALFVALYMI